MDPQPQIPARTAEQVASEAVFREVHETVVTIEAAIRRAERAAKILAREDNPHPYLLEATERVARELDTARRHLMQRTYWAMEESPDYRAEDPEAPSAEQVALFEPESAQHKIF